MGPRRFVLRLVAAALAASAIGAPTAVAAEVSVSVHRVDDVVVIEARALVDADAQTAWRVLTDYGRYPDFVPGLHESRVIRRQGARLVVVQSGDAPLWLLRMPYVVTYEVTEFPPFRVESTASASQLSRFESRYTLTPDMSGVRIEYQGQLAPRSALMGRFEQAAARQGVVREFEALAQEIERAGRH